jgi:hypothetical protein
MSQAIASASRDVTTWRDRFAARFFLAASIVMLAIVVLGFTPTLLLRPLFDVPSIPAYLFVHGAVLSALVAMHRTDLHRRSGIVGVAIAACVVGASLLAIVKWIPRMRELGTDFETEGARLASGIIGDSLMLVQFIPLVALAVLWRGRPAIHKRLMFLASLAILIPAGARTPTVFGALGLSPVAAPFAAYVLFTVAAPITYDLLTRKRPHVATIICVPANLGSVVVSIAIASNETARAFILGMF